MKTEIYIDLDGQELIKKTWEDGDIWFKNKNDKLHRLDGPAIVYSNGLEFWYKDGLRHRLDGPAVILSSGTEEYWLNGKLSSKREIDLIWLRKQVEE